MTTNPITATERGVIARFASGHTNLLQGALAIYNKYKPTLGATGAPEQAFMTHYDPANAARDYGLREAAARMMLGQFYAGN